MKPNFNKEDYKYLKQDAKDDRVFVYTRKTLNGGLSVAFKAMHQGAEARMVAVAVSYCAPEDSYRKKTGKYNALLKFYEYNEYVQLPLATMLSYEDADSVGEYLLDVFQLEY
jgi:hypothetical protein